MKLLIVFVAIIIIAIALYDNSHKSTDTNAIEQNIQILKNSAMRYEYHNKGSFKGISVVSMRSDGLLPNGWITSGNLAYPSNKNRTDAFWVGQNAWKVAGTFDIGVAIADSNITNNMARAVCFDFVNQIKGLGYGGKAYNLSRRFQNEKLYTSTFAIYITTGDYA